MSLLLNNNIGYTIVGSPTISNNIASGFDSGNYLTISNSKLDLRNIVFHCKFKTGNNISVGQSIFQFGSTGAALPFLFWIQDNYFWVFYAGKANENKYTHSNINLSTNTEYEAEFGTINSVRYFKFGTVGNMVDVPLTMGTDEDWNGSLTKDIWIGNAGPDLITAFTGSIDLNETYIKVNEVTWFNGKQNASTNINKITYNNNVGYTIIGSPTITDGIASNFSNGNYIKLQSNIPIITSFEENVKFKITQDCAGKSLLSYSTTYNSNNLEGNINISNNLDSINVYLFIKYNDTYEEYSIQYNFSQHLNKYFTFKVYTDLSNVYLYLYDENNTLVGTNTYTNINLAGIIDDNKILIGNIYDESDYWPSEIDLNNTYIKFNDITWFNGREQANTSVDYLTINNGQIGYTIVGSPTINNGQISNTGNGNYISLPSINLFSNSSFEYKASFYIGENVLTGEGYIVTMPFIGADGVLRSYGTYFGGGWLTIYCGVSADNTDIDYYTQLTPNTYYSIIWKKENGVLTTSLKVGNNPIQQILSDNGADLTNNPSGAAIALGGLDMKDGYIDLKDTYIKVNDVYWFNGGSKLIWCDPNIYLQGDGNQLIVTDIYPNSNYTLEANIKPIYNSTEYNNSIIDTAGNVDETGRIGFLYRDEDLSSEAAGCIFYNYYPTTISSWTKYQFNKKYNLKTIKDSENTYFYVNGNLDNTRALETLETSTQPLKFWNYNSKGILYNVKVNDDNGNLVGHFIPVKQGMILGGGYLAPSNGMFDIVEQKFYPNLGTGTFNIGKD